MEKTFFIRSLSNECCDQVIKLILPIQQIEFNVPVTLEDQPDLLDIEKNYHQGGGNFWGAIDDGQIIGTIALINTGYNAGAIRKMFVQKAYRGKDLAVAQQLFDTLVGFCYQKKITELFLGTVEQLKAACRFYERNGFKKIKSEDLPKYFPKMKPDNVFYHLHLNND